MPPLDKKADKKYTYQEYLNWPDDERWEIFAKELYYGYIEKKA